MVKKELFNKKTISIIAAAELFIILILVTVLVANANSKTEYENANTTDLEVTDEAISESTTEINKSEWNLILVNKDNPIPENYTVNLTQLINGHSIDERCYEDLQQMMDDCRAEGLEPVICSSYRTNEKQTELFNRQIEKWKSLGYSDSDAEIEAGKLVAVPGTSEHQLGLALDIVDISYQILDEKQENTAVQKWLMQNSYKYGFIFRYPGNKTHITNVAEEVWHYRYVGKEAAAEIRERGICLEEYLENPQSQYVNEQNSQELPVQGETSYELRNAECGMGYY